MNKKLEWTLFFFLLFICIGGLIGLIAVMTFNPDEALRWPIGAK